MKDEIMSVIVNFAECTLDDFISDGFIKKVAYCWYCIFYDKNW